MGARILCVQRYRHDKINQSKTKPYAFSGEMLNRLTSVKSNGQWRAVGRESVITVQAPGSKLHGASMGPAWGQSGAYRTQVGPMLAACILLGQVRYSYIFVLVNTRISVGISRLSVIS